MAWDSATRVYRDDYHKVRPFSEPDDIVRSPQLDSEEKEYLAELDRARTMTFGVNDHIPLY